MAIKITQEELSTARLIMRLIFAAFAKAKNINQIDKMSDEELDAFIIEAAKAKDMDIEKVKARKKD